MLDEKVLDFPVAKPHNGSMTSTTAVYDPASQVKTASRFVSAHKRWIAKCEALRTAEEVHGRDSVEFWTAFRAWEKGRVPSKNSKYHAYDAAAAVRRYLAEAHGLHLERAETVADIEFTIETYRLVKKG